MDLHDAVAEPPAAWAEADNGAAARPESTSLGKAFDVLGLFSVAAPLLRIEDVIARLGYTRSTAYRYLKELCDAGLLAPASGGGYALGLRIIELERQLELTDPLCRAARSVLPAERREDSVLLLQKLYRDDQVMCVYKEGPDVVEHGGRRITIKRARGLPFPLFRGAASLALLAWMTPHRIQRAYLSGAAHIAGAGLGADWNAFRETLAAIRRKGHAVSRGHLMPVVVGVAVPVMLADDKRVVGSLAQVFACDVLQPQQERDCAARLRELGARIAAEFARDAARGEAA